MKKSTISKVVKHLTNQMTALSIEECSMKTQVKLTVIKIKESKKKRKEIGSLISQISNPLTRDPNQAQTLLSQAHDSIFFKAVMDQASLDRAAVGLIKGLKSQQKEVQAIQAKKKDLYSLINEVSPRVPTKVTISKDEEGVHLAHCFQGEYDSSCKYGKDQCCPAKA